MKMKRWLRTRASAVLTSPLYRELRRTKQAVTRRLTGRSAVVHYFHQVDDPYSDLAVRALPHLSSHYDICVIPHIVPAPDKGAAPEPERLMQWSLRDAAELARALGQNPHPWQTAPAAALLSQAQAALAGISDVPEFAAVTAKIREAFSGDEVAVPDIARTENGNAKHALEEGESLRHKLGHYLGGMYYFEGEWYWGLDRLPYLEERLQPLAKVANLQPFVRRLEASVTPTADAAALAAGHQPKQATTNTNRPRLDLYFSFRSPYSWIALPRVFELARTYNAELHLRFVLPMVMRGLPIPESKRLYIVTDTKREAERVGLPFGLIADPVGKPTERGLAVLHHAIQLGKGEAFALSFMRGVFAEGINARSDTGLLRLCERVGISETQMQSALADNTWRAVAEANREEMFTLGIWGVPAFRVNGGTAHWGQDRLWLLEQQLAACQKSAMPS
ncbi:DsbA family protein [Pseudohongiella spirulinae]|uniref:2-hydroxychromene-2-carboxylate isomerase n=1 Tax=Pseudohongiella spirulinae TaxID=1249552 RepID=A0A0S2KGS8_9GAMM|nr:DsbA family protein [Pseudohongiella spirulinae]ALO47449.1 2-hydroxychromene-2-carboxylate isomerase [Pseudohongiella spirulinae]